MPVKLHKSLAQGVIDCLVSIFNHNKVATIAMEVTLKSHPKWGSRDRKWVASTTYDMVRNWRMIKSMAGIHERKITDTAKYWLLLGAWLKHQNFLLPDWEEFKNVTYLPPNLEEPKIKYSITDWLYSYGLESLGEEKWHRYLDAMHGESPVFLRVNSSKISSKELQEKLWNENIEVQTFDDSPNTLELVKRKALHSLDLWKKGYFEVQDMGSQRVILCLQNLEPKVILDACAGAGGKTLQLADLFPQSTVLSSDSNRFKLKELKTRLGRNGFSNVEILDIPSLENLNPKVDLLVLDAPCSGSGTFSRNVDAKWKLKADFLKEIKKTQKEILQKNCQYLVPGGRLLYATCSIFPEENELQIEHFLQLNPSFQLVEQKNLPPQKAGGDGFYYALLLKN